MSEWLFFFLLMITFCSNEKQTDFAILSMDLTTESSMRFGISSVTSMRSLPVKATRVKGFFQRDGALEVARFPWMKLAGWRVLRRNGDVRCRPGLVRGSVALPS